MKKALLLLGMIAAGAASGGVVAWSILSPAEKNGTHVVTPQSGAVSDDPFSQAGTHFTSYQAEQYPDLTYAAENAVKAVVNIEVLFWKFVGVCSFISAVMLLLMALIS